jgi:hypothetical protein
LVLENTDIWVKEQENQRLQVEQLLAEAESAQISQLQSEEKIQKLQHFVQVECFFG